jgi:hypothetical protein
VHPAHPRVQKGNSRLKPRAGILVLVSGMILLSVGCGTTRVEEMRAESETVEPEGAETVRAEIAMGAGILDISGGAQQLMEANFAYNVPEWEPEVDYEVTGGEGVLRVEQPSAEGGIDLTGDARNEWEVRLNEGMPTDLSVRIGAGESDLELGSLNLTGLSIEMGAGASTVDLRGEWEEDLEAKIRGGAGSATLRLPTNVGVRVETSGGLGEIEARDLRREEGAYVNEAYGESDVTLEVDFEGGVGRLSLVAEE